MEWRKYQEQQKVVELGDRFMSYVERGDGPPLVLLHGAPTWGYLWHSLLPELEKDRKVIVPDLLGYGFSDRSDRFGRGPAAQAAALSAFLQTLGLEHVDLVGHDLGGAVALRLAAFEPERVGRLSLINAACYDSSRDMPERRLRELLKAGFRAPDETLVEGLLAPYRTEAGRLSLSRNLAAIDVNQTMELVPLLPQVHAPTLLLWGEEDPFRPVDYGRRLASDLPKARISVIPQGRHYLPLEKPEQVAGVLLNFLQN